MSSTVILSNLYFPHGGCHSSCCAFKLLNSCIAVCLLAWTMSEPNCRTAPAAVWELGSQLFPKKLSATSCCHNQPVDHAHSANRLGPRHQLAARDIAVPLCIDGTLPDFLVPADTFDRGLQRVWNQGDRFRMFFAGRASSKATKGSQGGWAWWCLHFRCSPCCHGMIACAMDLSFGCWVLTSLAGGAIVGSRTSAAGVACTCRMVVMIASNAL